jgi:hypothetical protein
MTGIAERANDLTVSARPFWAAQLEFGMGPWKGKEVNE